MSASFPKGSFDRDTILFRRIVPITGTNQYAPPNSLLTATNGYGVWQDICSAIVSAGYVGPFDVSGWSAQLISTTAGIYANPIFTGSATITGTLNVPPALTMIPQHIGIGTQPTDTTLTVSGDILVRGVFKCPSLPADIISVSAETDYSGGVAHLPPSTRSAHIHYSDSSRSTVYLPSPTIKIPTTTLIVHNQTADPITISVADGTRIFDVSSTAPSVILPSAESRQFVLGSACSQDESPCCSTSPYVYYQRPFVGPDFPSLDPYVDLSAGAAILASISTNANAVADISVIIATRPTQSVISSLSTSIAASSGSYNTLSTYVGTSTATSAAFTDLSAAVEQAANQISILDAAAQAAIQTLLTPAQLSSFSTSIASLTSEISHLSTYCLSAATLANYSTTSSSVQTLSTAVQDISDTLLSVATAADFAATSSAFSTATADFSTLSTTFDSIKTRDVTRADYNKQVDDLSNTIQNIVALSTNIDAAYRYYSTTTLHDQFIGMSNYVIERFNTQVIYNYNSYYSANMIELSTYIDNLIVYDSTLRSQITASTATKQDLSILSSSLLNVYALSTYVGQSVPTLSTISSIYRADIENRSAISTLSSYINLNVPSNRQYSTLQTAAAVYNTRQDSLAAYIYGTSDPGAASKAALSTVGDGMEFISTGISSLAAYVGASTIPLSTFTDLSAAFAAYSTGTVRRQDVSNIAAAALQIYGTNMSTISTLEGRVQDLSGYVYTSLVDALDYNITKSTFTKECLSNYTTASSYIYYSTAKLSDYATISSIISTSYATPYGTLSTYVANSTLTVQTFSTFSTTITNDLLDSVADLYANPEIIGDFLINSTATTAIIKPIGPRAVPGTAGGPLYVVGDPSGGINARSRKTAFTTWLGEEGAGGVTADFKGALSNVGGTFSGTLVNATGSFQGTLMSSGDLNVESGSITVARGNLVVDNSDIRVENGNIYAQTFYGNINGPSYTDTISQLDTSQNIRTAGDLTVGYSLFGRGRTAISTLVAEQILLKPNLVPLQQPRPFEAQQFTQAPFNVDASGMGVRVEAGFPVVYAWRQLVYNINTANFQRYPPNGWAPAVFRLDKTYQFFTLEIRQSDDGLMTVPGQDIQQHTAGYIRINGRAGVSGSGGVQAQALDVEFELANGSTATPLFQDIQFNSGTGAFGYLTVWLWVGQTGIQADSVIYDWRGTNNVQIEGFAGNTDTVVVADTAYIFRGIGAFQPQPPFVADGGEILVSGKTELLGAGRGGSIVAQAESVNGVMLGVNRLNPAYNLDVSGSALVARGPVDICGGIVTDLGQTAGLQTNNMTADNLAVSIMNVSRTTAEGDAKTSVDGDLYVSGIIDSTGQATKGNYTMFIYCNPVIGVIPIGNIRRRSCYVGDIVIPKVPGYDYVSVIAMGGGGGGSAVIEKESILTDSVDNGNYNMRSWNGGGGGSSGLIKIKSYKTTNIPSNIILNIGLGGAGGLMNSGSPFQPNGIQTEFSNRGFFDTSRVNGINGGQTNFNNSLLAPGGYGGYLKSLPQSGLVVGRSITQGAGGNNGLYGGGAGAVVWYTATTDNINEDFFGSGDSTNGISNNIFTSIDTSGFNGRLFSAPTIKTTLTTPLNLGNGGYSTSINGLGGSWALFNTTNTGAPNDGRNNYLYPSVLWHSQDDSDDYKLMIDVSPAGGGGGPYGGNGGYYSQAFYKNEPSNFRLPFVSATKASYGCGGGGGVAAVTVNYETDSKSNGVFKLSNPNYNTASRGGDGWVLLEFYNEKPQYNPFQFGPSGRFCDIRDIIEPALKFADETHEISVIPPSPSFPVINYCIIRQTKGTINSIPVANRFPSIYAYP